MPEYTNFDDLLKGAQSIIDNTLKTAVADEVKKTISQTAKENVILQTPGRSSGGIDDVNSMVGEVKTTGGESVLTVKDVAKPSFPTEKLLSNTQPSGNCYVVPKMVD